MEVRIATKEVGWHSGKAFSKYCKLHFQNLPEHRKRGSLTNLIRETVLVWCHFERRHAPPPPTVMVWRIGTPRAQYQNSVMEMALEVSQSHSCLGFKPSMCESSNIYCTMVIDSSLLHRAEIPKLLSHFKMREKTHVHV